MNLDDVVPSIAQQRIVAGAPATLEVIFTDQNGEPAAASGTVTVKVTRADGAVVLAANTATQTDSSTVGRYTVALTGAETASLDLLTATWSVTGTPSKVTLVDVVGAVYFTVAEARERVKSLVEDLYSDADIIDARRDVETEFEDICGAAFVPRFRRLNIDSTGTSYLQVPNTFLRAVREVTPPGGPTFDSGELATISTSISGELTYPAGFPWFAEGIVAIEHGLDRPPPAMKAVAFMRLRELLSLDDAGVEDRTTTYTVNGVTYNLGGPGKRTTGNPLIDAVLARYDYTSLVAT